ncbi:hypothetical protein FB45DRAFT_917822 [Roridomyces roridus]|uniref:Uncharacterized protein n=1 Tax=Roridomyces roridus TaxID=1738132 RepID=A0AAD7BUZ0_9AGAR|nr:hypothetical protein FB45DRAFT_917822 [Roridomyces roridus]
MNHPRPSILHLFDPLAARDNEESLKENALPDDFLPQTYLKYPSPVRLTTRLVEVGDTTVQIEEEDEGEDEADENHTMGAHSPSSPRTPLVDTSYDRERTPMRSRMYKLNSKPATEVSDELDANPTFSVVVCPASSTESSSSSLATVPLSTPTGSLITDTTMALPTPSEASTSLLAPIPSARPTPLDMDHSSADLQSSFAFHLSTNAADASFDLLNDKISFLGMADEESFDMGNELGVISEDRSRELEDAQNGPDSPVQQQLPSAGEEPVNSRAAEETVERDLTPSPPALSFGPVFVAPPAKPSPPKVIPTLPTTLPEPPSLVPALKIVKRQRPYAATSSLPPKTASTRLNTVAADAASSAASAPAVASAAATASSTTGRYVMEGPGPWRVPASNSKDKEKIVRPTPGAAVGVSGPRRVLVAPAAVPVSAPVPPSKVAALAGPKRPLRVVPPNGAQPAPASGLPRAAGSSIGGSRLPMPKSKIAVPSGLPRRRVP